MYTELPVWWFIQYVYKNHLKLGRFAEAGLRITSLIWKTVVL